MSRARRPPPVPPVATIPKGVVGPTTEGTATTPTGSAWLRRAAAFVAFEGVALVVVSLLYGANVHDEGHGLSAWGAAAVGAVCGAVIVGVLARALARSSRSAVAPTVLLQLICIGEAYNMTQEQKWSYAVVVTVLAVGALGATALGLRQLPADED
ncbi:MAG: hypothetical protein QOG52_690 [Frankiaceae bacterium]|nr:hypothetical protein [Frankiaceae bacterium]